MIRYFITFSYDGSCFSGFQRQKNLKTVQGTIENAIKNLGVGDVSINASGRTDKGVHALNQKAHFDLDVKFNKNSLIKYINKKCEGKIYVKDIIEVQPLFHARYMVDRKTYSYYINVGEFDVFRRNYVYQYNKELNIDLMVKASKCLLGEHNFRSFCNNSKERKGFVRKIYDISITRDLNIIKISITGNGFLRAMVRNIVGILIEIGSGKKDIIYMKEVLDLQDRGSYVLKSALGCGLYLEDVIFKNR